MSGTGAGCRREGGSERKAILLERPGPGALSRRALLEELGLRVLEPRDAAEAARLAAEPDVVLALVELDYPCPGCGLGAFGLIRRSSRVELILIVPEGADPIVVEASARVLPRGYLPADAPGHLARAAVSSAIAAADFDAAHRIEAERLRAAAAAHPDLMLVLDEEGVYRDVLTSNHGLLYRKPEELIGHRATDVLPADYAVLLMDLLGRTGRGEAGATIEYSLNVKAGSLRFEGRAAPAGLDPEGKRLFVYIARDITARKRAEEALKKAVEEKGFLLKELQHRVKNNLAMMSSIFSIGSEKAASEELRSAFEEAQSRLSAMAYVYEELYRSEGILEVDAASFIGDIGRGLVGVFAGESGRVGLELSVADLVLDVKRAVPLGLALTELVTNAFKYGFGGERGGTLSISLERREGSLVLSVENDGEPLPEGFDPERSRGTGLKLIGHFSAQLGGSFRWTRGREGKGARFELAFSPKG